MTFRRLFMYNLFQLERTTKIKGTNMSFNLGTTYNFTSDSGKTFEMKKLVVKYCKKGATPYYVLDFEDNKKGYHADAAVTTLTSKNEAEEILEKFKNKGIKLYLDLSLSGSNKQRDDFIQKLEII